MITKETWSRGAVNGITSSFTLLKIIIPVFAAVTALGHTPVIGRIARFCEPVMNLAGLPGEAALAFVTGALISMYAAVGIIIALSLTSWQITTLAVMLALCHELFVESAVMKKADVTVWPLVLLRLLSACFAGWLMNLAGSVFL